jgi:hypothetical protein
MSRFLQVPLKMHWIITLKLPAGEAGSVTSTFDGVRRVPPGTARSAVFREVLAEQARRMIRPPGTGGAEPNVMFFALEPDEIERGH